MMDYLYVDSACVWWVALYIKLWITVVSLRQTSTAVQNWPCVPSAWWNWSTASCVPSPRCVPSLPFGELAATPGTLPSCDCPNPLSTQSATRIACSLRKNRLHGRFAAGICCSSISRQRPFCIGSDLLEVPIFGLGEWKLLLFFAIKYVLIFRKFQDEFEGLSHAVLNQLLLGFLQLYELLHQRTRHLALPYSWETHAELALQQMKPQIWIFHQETDDLSE